MDTCKRMWSKDELKDMAGGGAGGGKLYYHEVTFTGSAEKVSLAFYDTNSEKISNANYKARMTGVKCPIVGGNPLASSQHIYGGFGYVQADGNMNYYYVTKASSGSAANVGSSVMSSFTITDSVKEL